MAVEGPMPQEIAITRNARSPASEGLCEALTLADSDVETERTDPALRPVMAGDRQEDPQRHLERYIVAEGEHSRSISLG